MTREQSIAQEVEQRESYRRMRYGNMVKGPFAPVKNNLIVPYLSSDKEQLLKEHLFYSDGMGASAHNDDISESAVGIFFSNGTIEGLPIRAWYVEKSLDRLNKNREDIIYHNKNKRKVQ
jgi:hypothetical protein